MDEFELAGFDEATCKQLRKITEETGIEPERLICAIRNNPEETQYLIDFAQLETAWGEFKQAVWGEFEKSKIEKFMIWLDDKLSAWFERLGK